MQHFYVAVAGIGILSVYLVALKSLIVGKVQYRRGVEAVDTRATVHCLACGKLDGQTVRDGVIHQARTGHTVMFEALK